MHIFCMANESAVHLSHLAIGSTYANDFGSQHYKRQNCDSISGPEILFQTSVKPHPRIVTAQLNMNAEQEGFVHVTEGPHV